MAAVGVTHHVKLGDQYLIVRPNTYQKSPAPTFGARIATGDPDYNNLSIWQHWVQKCWVGGMDAPEWVDDAMFKDGVGLDTTEHEKFTLSRTLVRGAGGSANWSLGGRTSVANHEFIVYKDVLYCLVSVDAPGDDMDSRLYSYNATTQAWTAISMPGAAFNARCMATFDGKLFVAGAETTGTDYARMYYCTTPGTWTIINNPVGVGGNPGVTAMKVYNTKLYVCFGTQVWRMVDTFEEGTVAKTWDGNTVFYKLNSNSGSNSIRSMEVHLGFLYMLSHNGHLHRTDGNNTFDIWSWDGQTAGISLRSYDGKLFVGTYEYTDATDQGMGALYQFTGAAVTELKRWGKIGRTTLMSRMVVHNRRLFYGASDLFGIRPGFGVACYDAVEDGHSIYAMQDDAAAYPDTNGTGIDWIIDDICVFGGKMFVVVRGHGVFFTEDSFRDVETGRAQFTTSAAGGILTSSLYDGGTPGLMKLWRRITVWATLPSAATSMTVAFSVNNGVSWSSMPPTVGTDPLKSSYTYYIGGNIRSADFMYRITLNTSDESKSPTIRGVSIAYLPQPEPNWQWSFVVPVADKWELIDKTIETKNTNSLIAYIEGLFRAQVLVEFIDIDGVKWALDGPGVLVYDMNTLHYDVEAPAREADVRLTLLEAVESY